MPGDNRPAEQDSAAGEKGFSGRVEVNPFVSVREGDFVYFTTFTGILPPGALHDVRWDPVSPRFR